MNDVAVLLPPLGVGFPVSDHWHVEHAADKGSGLGPPREQQWSVHEKEGKKSGKKNYYESRD